MGGKYTPAQRKATDKYNATLKNIGIRVKHEDYNRYKSFADSVGMSLRELIMLSIEEKIERTK